MIALKQGEFELDISPEIGGSVARFAFGGRDVLRQAPKGTTDVLDMGCFPLVPYANRIENGLLPFEGREYKLVPNMGDHPHPLHGYGWHRAWRVASVSRDAATLAFDHDPSDWPWAFSAEQVFTLGEDGLTAKLSVRSRASSSMPVCLGFHPYFPRHAGSRLTASVQGMWKGDATMIPTEHVDGSPLIDLAHGALVDKAPFVDNCFTGWRSPARIDQPDGGMAVSLEASPECRFFHIYIPVGQTFFCAEPVTAMPNAFNRKEPADVTGARVLAPGATLAIEMRIVARRA
jgi:aldose 1-epimerase